MAKAAEALTALEMSRVERNEAIYRENDARSGRSFNRTAGSVLRVLGMILMVFMLTVCVGLSLPRLAGYNAYVVVSGSMEPSIPVGSLVYAAKTDPATLEKGDVIVFIDPARGTTPITHRVVANDTFARTITTKGDANANIDMPGASYDNVIGKVKVHIPYIGFAASLFSSAVGKVIAGLVLIEAWLLIEIGRRLRRTA